MRDKIKLSRRLICVASYVKGKRVVDVGCDHAYLPMYLIKNNIVDSAIAVDVACGAIDIARKNVINYGLEDKIEIRKSNGLENVLESEVENITICGMGGILAARILSESLSKTLSSNRIIVQPQSEVFEFLNVVKEMGLCVVTENFIEDRGKFYPIFVLEKGIKSSYKFGDFLIKDKNKDYYRYLIIRKNKYEKLYLSLKDNVNAKKIKDKYNYYAKEVKRWEYVN